jgi:hypothetical protein
MPAFGANKLRRNADALSALRAAIAAEFPL